MVLAVAWTLATLASLFLPGGYLPTSGWSYDKVAHFMLFGGLSGLWMIALGDRVPHAYLYVIVFSLAYGAFTEIGQELTSGGRHGDPLDALADAIGVISGVLAFRLWKIWKARYLTEEE
jgi:VanZ family protein